MSCFVRSKRDKPDLSRAADVVQIDYAAKIAAAASIAAVVLCSSDEASELFPASTASVIPG